MLWEHEKWWPILTRNIPVAITSAALGSLACYGFLSSFILEAKNATIENLTVENAGLTGKLNESTAGLNSLRTDVARLSTAAKDAEARSASASAAKGALERRLADEQAKRQSSEAHLAKIQAELEAAKARNASELGAGSERTAKLAEELKASNRALAKDSDESARLRQAMETERKLTAELRSKVSKLEAEISVRSGPREVPPRTTAWQVVQDAYDLAVGESWLDAQTSLGCDTVFISEATLQVPGQGDVRVSVGQPLLSRSGDWMYEFLIVKIASYRGIKLRIRKRAAIASDPTEARQ